MDKIKQIESVADNVEKLEHGWWGYEMVQPLWKTIWRVLNKVNLEFLYDPQIPLQGIYSKELKMGVQTKTRTQMFQKVETPQRPSAD